VKIQLITMYDYPLFLINMGRSMGNA